MIWRLGHGSNLEEGSLVEYANHNAVNLERNLEKKSGLVRFVKQFYSRDSFYFANQNFMIKLN